MGTNFYARILPKKERKEKLKELIDSDDFSGINDLVGEMYSTVGEYNTNGGVIHIGKRSAGWKFLWNPNWYEYDDGTYDVKNKKWIPNPKIKKWYDLTRESIYKFLRREDVRIFNEYGEEIAADDFIKDIEEWDSTPWVDGSEKYDGESYEEHERNNGSYSQYDRYGDEREKKWKKLGFNPTCYNFYSDGLRFSTATDFS